MSKRRKKLVVEQWADIALENLGFMSKWEEQDYIEFVEKHGKKEVGESLAEFQRAEAFDKSGRQVFIFDDSFAASIIGEKWDDLLPDVIERMPFESFYIKLPCCDTSEGVVVMVSEADENDPWIPKDLADAVIHMRNSIGKGIMYYQLGERARELLLVNTGEKVYVLLDWPVPNNFDLMFDDTKLQLYPTRLVANALAYICSSNADIKVSYKPNVAKRRDGKRRSTATWHEVGFRIGAELRAYERTKSERKPHQGGTMRPHMRRAHWHHFWTGTRNGERKLVLKWVPPTMVAVKNGDIEVATGHRVPTSKDGE